MKIPCPGCWGVGVTGVLHGPPSVGVGDYLMVSTFSREKGRCYVKCQVTKFKPSGIKAINDGRYTFRWPAGKIERRSVGYGNSNELYTVCPQCEGAREVEPIPRDLDILDGIEFLVSGKGTLRAAKDDEGLWWAFRQPSLSHVDLLTDVEGKVYKPTSIPRLEGHYQVFTLGYIDKADAYVDETPKECGTHGWYFEDSCPECA